MRRATTIHWRPSLAQIGSFFKAWLCNLHGLHIIDGGPGAHAVRSSGGGPESPHDEFVRLVESPVCGVLTVSNHSSVLDDPVLASVGCWAHATGACV